MEKDVKDLEEATTEVGEAIDSKEETSVETNIDESTFSEEDAEPISEEDIKEMESEPSESNDRSVAVGAALVLTKSAVQNLAVGEILYIFTDILKSVSELSNIPMIDVLQHIYLGATDTTEPSKELGEFITKEFGENTYPVYDGNRETFMVIFDNGVIYSQNVREEDPTINVNSVSKDVTTELNRLSPDFINATVALLKKLERTRLVVKTDEPSPVADDGVVLAEPYAELDKAQAAVKKADDDLKKALDAVKEYEEQPKASLEEDDTPDTPDQL